MKKYPVIVPDYYDRFQCIGGDCPDTCCKDWNVLLDKKTYKKYLDLPKTGDSPMEKGCVVRNKEKQSTMDYAQIQMCGDGGHCPFLTEEKLCGIYLKYGGDYMGYVCKAYPRLVIQNRNEYQLGMRFSCPELVRQVLEAKEPIQFLQDERSKNDVGQYFHGVIDEHLIQSRPSKQYYSEIRDASIVILQNRRFKVSERLVLLGLLIERLMKCEESGEISDIPKTCEDFNRLIENVDSQQLFSKFQKNLSVQMEIANFSVRAFSEEAHRDGTLEDILKDTYEQLALGRYLEESAAIYYVLSEGGMEEFMTGEGAVYLEHFLVNEFYIRMMPFGTHKTMREAMITLCAAYSILKMMLFGQARKHETMNREIFGDTLYRFVKYFLHKPTFHEVINEITEQLEIHSVGGMYLMVHD